MTRRTAKTGNASTSSAPTTAPERPAPPPERRGDNITLDDDDHAILDDIWKTIRDETAAAAKLRAVTLET